MNVHLNPSLLKFGTVTIVSDIDDIDDTAPVAVYEPPPTADDTAQFIAEVERDEVYLKLPIPAFVVRLWTWFDERMGVKYR